MSEAVPPMSRHTPLPAHQVSCGAKASGVSVSGVIPVWASQGGRLTLTCMTDDSELSGYETTTVVQQTVSKDVELEVRDDKRERTITVWDTEEGVELAFFGYGPAYEDGYDFQEAVAAGKEYANGYCAGFQDGAE